MAPGPCWGAQSGTWRGRGPMLECPVRYMDVTEGSRAKLEYPVGYIDVT
jgi:hypothetical protein